jgi:hypothetical protein
LIILNLLQRWDGSGVSLGGDETMMRLPLCEFYVKRVRVA